MVKHHRLGARKAVAEARVERSHRRRASPLAGAGTMTYGAELDAGDVVNVTEAKGIEGTDPEA